MTVTYCDEDWVVVGKSLLPGGWWIQKTVEGRPVVVEALRKELGQATVR
jgi:hypothetical protein